MKSDTLDLHGVKHQDVMRKVDEFMGEMITSNHHHLYIVTGISVHMQDIVISTLKDYNLDYEVGDYFNPGYIKINLK
jgi:hypothetical protein